MAALKYDIICLRHNKVLFAPLSVLVGRCRLDVFSSFLPFSRLSTFIIFVY